MPISGLDMALKYGQPSAIIVQPTPLSTISARVKKLVAAENRHSWRG